MKVGEIAKLYKLRESPVSRITQNVGVEKSREKSPRLNLLCWVAMEKKPVTPPGIFIIRKIKISKTAVIMTRNCRASVQMTDLRPPMHV